MIYTNVLYFRAKEQAARSVREGPTYETNVAVNHVSEANIQEIAAPHPTDPPKACLKDEGQQLVFFDLETTSRR